MNALEYKKYVDEGRTRFLNEQVVTVQELRGILSSFASACSNLIEKYKEDELRKKYYSEVLVDLHFLVDNLNNQMLSSIYKGIRNSVFLAEIPTKKIFKDLLGRYARDEDVAQMVATVSERALMAHLAKTIKGLKVSDRIWQTSDKARQQLEKIIQEGIALGRDPREVARDIQYLLNPGVAKPHRKETAERLGIKDDIPYQATRLAITEMESAYHEASILHYSNTPGYKGVKWVLSKSHAVQDICDEYAKEEIFYAGTEPTKPHPYCRCYVVPIYDEEEVERIKQDLRKNIRTTYKPPKDTRKPFAGLPANIRTWITSQTQITLHRDYILAGFQNRITPLATTKEEAQKIAEELGFAKYIDYSDYPNADIPNELNEAIARFFQEFDALKGRIDMIAGANTWRIGPAIRNAIVKKYKEVRQKMEEIRLDIHRKRIPKEVGEALIKELKKKTDKYVEIISEHDSKGYADLISLYKSKATPDDPDLQEIFKGLGKFIRKEEITKRAFTGITWLTEVNGRNGCLFNENAYEGDYIDTVLEMVEHAISGWHPIHHRTPRSVAYHELGHLLDGFIRQNLQEVDRIAYQQNLEELYAKLRGMTSKDKDYLCDYGKSSLLEFVAELMSNVMSAKEINAELDQISTEGYNIIKKYYERAIQNRK